MICEQLLSLAADGYRSLASHFLCLTTPPTHDLVTDLGTITNHLTTTSRTAPRWVASWRHDVQAAGWWNLLSENHRDALDAIVLTPGPAGLTPVTGTDDDAPRTIDGDLAHYFASTLARLDDAAITVELFAKLSAAAPSLQGARMLFELGDDDGTKLLTGIERSRSKNWTADVILTAFELRALVLVMECLIVGQTGGWWEVDVAAASSAVQDWRATVTKYRWDSYLPVVPWNEW